MALPIKCDSLDLRTECRGGGGGGVLGYNMGPKRPTLEPNCYAFLVDQDFFGRFSFNSPVISNPPPPKKNCILSDGM